MSENVLSKSAQSIQDALAKKGLSCKVVQLSESTHTAQQAADALGCEVAHIIKSLVFCTQHTKKPILVLASGINRVNEKIIHDLVGENIIKAPADFVREVTGFAIGGVPPIGHKQTIDTFIDQDLLQYQELWAAAGTPHAVFCLQAKDLAHITGGKIVRIH